MHYRRIAKLWAAIYTATQLLFCCFLIWLSKRVVDYHLSVYVHILCIANVFYQHHTCLGNVLLPVPQAQLICSFLCQTSIPQFLSPFTLFASHAGVELFVYLLVDSG